MSNVFTPQRVAALHYCMAGVWALLIIPTLLLWKDSVTWVAFMSLYANGAAHLSAAKASRAEQEAEK
ncbi:hypothetical protein [Streptomyces sp. NPDC048521]|uniref:hypothetical protein n=1 Tax=Streptomyces sp. NPDC048521 TaxID=3365566 RepID=UPI0037141346